MQLFLAPREVYANAVLVGLIFSAISIGSASTQEKVLNLYTARHYATDEAFYTGFTKATGIKVDRIEGGEDALFERIRPKAQPVLRTYF